MRRQRDPKTGDFRSYGAREGLSEPFVIGITNLARLYDPLSTRTLKRAEAYELPTAIARVNRAGKEVFTKLPFILRSRLRYDPINHTLEFSGILDELSYAGEPLLLPNVLSSRERDVLKSLTEGDTDWAGVVDRLYHLSRNPNGVDLNPVDLPPDQDLRLGLAPQYVYTFNETTRNANIGVSTTLNRTATTLKSPAGTDLALLPGFRITGTTVVVEPLGDLPKALTAGLAGIPAANPEPGSALLFNGNTNSVVHLGGSTRLAGRPFTLEFWVRRDTGNERRVFFRGGNSSPRGRLAIGFTTLNPLYFEFEQVSPPMVPVTPQYASDLKEWVHWACSYDPVENLRQIFRNGLRSLKDNPPGGAFEGTGDLFLSQDFGGGATSANNFIGALDDSRIWTSARTRFGILQDLAKRLTGDEPTLARYFRCDETTAGIARDWNPDSINAPFDAGVSRITSDAPTGIHPRYLTLVENNDVALGALPVVVHIIRIDDGTFAGEIGDTSGTIRPRAALAEGWVKRVIRGLNPFDARVKDFHAAPINTFSSMLVQAGQRYEGDIAFNPSADNQNGIGLIEAYQTVLKRARSLSIEGTPPVNFNPANNALLLASSRIADLYMLLGNEAYADAQDPTIGFGTTGIESGSAASSIFSFQNQMSSLLDEELSLLRGRDDTFAGVGARPVYNRLFWTYYALLRHPQFTWVPRTERVNVAGVAQEVDFLDERKFAKAASARAKAGSETVDLTYRLDYVEDPAGQWQGYQDSRPARAWGISDWARRAGQGAYLDWLTANAILPSIDPDSIHVGIRKIDRQTVAELGEISDEAHQVQATLDKADLGLNPVGLAKGVVTFDLDPTFNEVGSTAQKLCLRQHAGDERSDMVGQSAREPGSSRRPSGRRPGPIRSLARFSIHRLREIRIGRYPIGSGQFRAGSSHPGAHPGPS